MSLQHNLIVKNLIPTTSIIEHAPSLAQKLIQDEFSWDDLLIMLIKDLSTGNTPSTWVLQLAKEGNIALASKLMEHLGLGSTSIMDELVVEEQSWKEVFVDTNKEVKQAFDGLENGLNENDDDEYRYFLEEAMGCYNARTYSEAISCLDQSVVFLKTIQKKQLLAIESTYNAVSAKAVSIGKDLMHKKLADFTSGEIYYTYAHSLFASAQTSLINQDFDTASTTLELVQKLMEGEEIPSAELDKILTASKTPIQGFNDKPASNLVKDIIDTTEPKAEPALDYHFEYEWDTEKDTYLTDNYDILSNAQLQLKLLVSENEIVNRIKYLGLSHDRQKKHPIKWRNPYVAGKPIREKRIFVGRDDVFEFIKDGLASNEDESDTITSRNLVALLGHRRTGKTSLLLQLKRNRREILGPRVPIFIDVEGMLPFPGGLRNFFYKLACIIQRELNDEGVLLPEPQEEQFTDPAWHFQGFLRQAEKVLGNQGLVLMMDEFQALEPRFSLLDVDVYKMLRSLIQHDNKVDFILAGTMQMEQIMRQYRAAMFGSAITKRIDFLDERDARKLIVGPVSTYVSYTKEAEDLIVSVTACHPYFIQLTCWSLMRHLIERGKSRVFASDVEKILPDVIERGVHFDEIWASDTTELELYIMATVGELVQHRDTLCQITRIEDKLRSADRWPKSEDDLHEAIQNLTHKRILQQNSDGTEVSFQVGVFGRWVTRNKPVAVVKRDLQADAARVRRQAARQPIDR